MLQINSESVQIMLMQIMERFDRIDRTLERMNKLKECLEGDTLLDNYDLCQLLGITKYLSDCTLHPVYPCIPPESRCSPGWNLLSRVRIRQPAF